MTAAEQLLREQGFARMTTNRIAVSRERVLDALADMIGRTLLPTA